MQPSLLNTLRPSQSPVYLVPLSLPPEQVLLPLMLRIALESFLLFSPTVQVTREYVLSAAHCIDVHVPLPSVLLDSLCYSTVQSMTSKGSGEAASLVRVRRQSCTCILSKGERQARSAHTHSASESVLILFLPCLLDTVDSNTCASPLSSVPKKCILHSRFSTLDGPSGRDR